MTDWKVLQVIKITDGDTVRVVRETEIGVLEGLLHKAQDANRDKHGNLIGKSIRLITLDTPERGAEGYYDARQDLADWFDLHDGRIRVVTYETAGWDRILGDFYEEGNMSNTATQYMLRDKGWEPYVEPV